MFKKLFGAALVAVLFAGVSAQAATIAVAGGSGGTITTYGDDAFQIDNAEGGYTLTVDAGEDTTSILFDLIASPSNTLGNFLVSIIGDGFAWSVTGPAQDINMGNQYLATGFTTGEYLLTVQIPNNNQVDSTPFQPTLDITAQAVPLPAAAWMFLSVIAGAGLLRRKAQA